MAMSAAVQHRSDRPTAYRAFRVPRPAPRKTLHGGRLSPMAGAMRRILIVLLLALLLLPAPPKNKPEPFGTGPLLVRARPLPLNAADPGKRDLGPLPYLGGWQLRRAHPGFGGRESGWGGTE